MESLNLDKHFVVLGPEKNATTVLNTPDLYAQLDEQFNDFKGHELIACHSFSENWPSWEVHPNGDEIVVLLSGSATFILEIDGKPRTVNLSRAGEYVVVPRGVWHTAHIKEAAKMLFITPGEGTQNRDI